MNNISIDCDCDGSPATPELKDMGILASTDPVALDKACLDLVFNYESTAGDDANSLIRRIENLHGTHTVEYAQEIGLGTMSYNLIDIDNPAGLNDVSVNHSNRYNVYTVDGKKILDNAESIDELPTGVYIINGEKRVIQQ